MALNLSAEGIGKLSREQRTENGNAVRRFSIGVERGARWRKVAAEHELRKGACTRRPQGFHSVWNVAAVPTGTRCAAPGVPFNVSCTGSIQLA